MNTLQQSCSEILLIEDDAFVRQALTELIEDAGFTVAQAGDGVQALSYLQRCEGLPSLILLDLMMPRMNGFEFRLRQQANPHLQSIPTVALSAYAYRESQQLPLNVVALLPKPVNVDRLLQLITHYCSAAQELRPSSLTQPGTSAAIRDDAIIHSTPLNGAWV